MDSFYDVPRRPPAPTPVEKMRITRVVPEVSIICPSKPSMNNINSYKTWRNEQVNGNNPILTSNNENIQNGLYNRPMIRGSLQNSSQLFKKQVRFESPPLQQKVCQTYEPFTDRNDLHHDVGPSLNHNTRIVLEKTKFSPKEMESSNGRDFKDIYMANIPNRHLDLSVVELPRFHPIEDKETNEQSSEPAEIIKAPDNKENELPKTYREYLETQKKVLKVQQENPKNYKCVTDIFNYKRNSSFDAIKDSLRTNSGSEDMIRTKGAIFKREQKLSPPLETNPSYCTSLNPEQNIYRNGPTVAPNHCFEVIRNEREIPHTCETIGAPQNRQTNPVAALTTTEICCQHSKNPQNQESELTNRDLLKIIAQQNEQLLLLQKQVAMLLSRDQNHSKPIELPPQRINNAENCLNAEYPKSSHLDINNTPRKRGLSKFSVDVMTSFEVAIRPQHNRQNFVNPEPKIQEITEVESLATEHNDKTSSIHLQEPLEVPEMCPSPEPSINIHMNDYDSSDDEVSASEIGATFYHNLMGQVNTILRKAQVQTKEDLVSRIDNKIGLINKSNKTMHRVKEATLNHLKSIGVTIDNLDCDDSSQNSSSSCQNDSKDYSPTEISFAVKQLLMKYLPNEYLAKASQKQKQQMTFKNNEEALPIIKARPELSFASVQYLKKYNLIQSADINHKPNGSKGHLTSRGQIHNLENPKILDITALKMQPKLL